MISQNKCSANIREVISQARASEFSAGTDWYWAANESAQLMSDDFNVPLDAAAYVIAALSPGVRWESNVTAARKLLSLLPLGVATVVLPGYPPNVQKAKRIARGVWLKEPSILWKSYLKGPKVVAFAENIINPDSLQQVTIDTHAISVAYGKRFTAKDAPDLRVTEFARISSAYVRVAEEFNISPNQCQAVSWLVWRRLHKGRMKRK